MKVNENFVIRSVFGKTILMPVKSNEISNDPILLNVTATSIVQIAKDCNDLEELVKRCLDTFEITPNTDKEQGIRSFIYMLYDKSIIH